MISKEVFLKVNGLLKENAQGYRIIEENSEIPLKRFMACDHRGKPMRGYIVKKKNLYYYKCNTKACNNNKSANALNSLFEKLLHTFKVDKAKDMVKAITKQAVATFNQLTAGDQDEYRNLQDQHAEIIKKIDRLEERYVEEEIGGELYNKYRDKYNEEKAEIEKNLMKLSKQVSNLDESVGFAIKIAF